MATAESMANLSYELCLWYKNSLLGYDTEEFCRSFVSNDANILVEQMLGSFFVCLLVLILFGEGIECG